MRRARASSRRVVGLSGARPLLPHVRAWHRPALERAARTELTVCLAGPQRARRCVACLRSTHVCVCVWAPPRRYSVVGEIGDTLASSMIAMLIIDRVKMESEVRHDETVLSSGARPHPVFVSSSGLWWRGARARASASVVSALGARTRRGHTTRMASFFTRRPYRISPPP